MWLESLTIPLRVIQIRDLLFIGSYNNNNNDNNNKATFI